MKVPDWLCPEEDFIPSLPVEPEVRNAIQRYKDHFGKFDIDMVHYYPSEEIIKIINLCINNNKCYQELFPPSSDVLNY